MITNDDQVTLGSQNIYQKPVAIDGDNLKAATGDKPNEDNTELRRFIGEFSSLL